IDAVASDTGRQITAEMLMGSKAVNFRKGPNGTTYALVVIDPKAAANVGQQALQTSYKNQQAQWQRFLGEKSQKELADEMNQALSSGFGTATQ
ncbi:MAG: hypothetical protein ACO23R_19810, partial [bacterium]